MGRAIYVGLARYQPIPERHGAPAPRGSISAHSLQPPNYARQPMSMVPFKEPGSATIDDFHTLDIRVGRIVAVDAFPAAR